MGTSQNGACLVRNVAALINTGYYIFSLIKGRTANGTVGFRLPFGRLSFFLFFLTEKTATEGKEYNDSSYEEQNKHP